jgi:hypothetical protein
MLAHRRVSRSGRAAAMRQPPHRPYMAAVAAHQAPAQAPQPRNRRIVRSATAAQCPAGAATLMAPSQRAVCRWLAAKRPQEVDPGGQAPGGWRLGVSWYSNRRGGGAAGLGAQPSLPAMHPMQRWAPPPPPPQPPPPPPPCGCSTPAPPGPAGWAARHAPSWAG